MAGRLPGSGWPSLPESRWTTTRAGRGHSHFSCSSKHPPANDYPRRPALCWAGADVVAGGNVSRGHLRPCSGRRTAGRSGIRGRRRVAALCSFRWTVVCLPPAGGIYTGSTPTNSGARGLSVHSSRARHHYRGKLNPAWNTSSMWGQLGTIPPGNSSCALEFGPGPWKRQFFRIVW